MNQPSENSHYVRRVVLPSGRAIEVVYFDNEAAPADAARRRRQPASSTCTSAPSATAASSTRWNGRRPRRRSGRCCSAAPTASGSDLGVYDQTVVDRFDEELDRGTEALVEDLQRLTQANMEDEIERFTHALNSDAIWPMDF